MSDRLGELNRAYRKAADRYAETWDPQDGQRLDRLHSQRLALTGRTARPAKPESVERSERRRAERDARRRRTAERQRKVRRCKCGCGGKIPPGDDPRREFIDGHKDGYHNRRRSSPTAPDTLRVMPSDKPHEQAVSEGSKTEFCKTAHHA